MIFEEETKEVSLLHEDGEEEGSCGCENNYNEDVSDDEEDMDNEGDYEDDDDADEDEDEDDDETEDDDDMDPEQDDFGNSDNY